ncbi:sensor histidine kinase [Nonomuraea sp. NPDC049725]|uniref:sensor histidine kinase n=1 Tax=Nonomuraea sp. NPDC049725 TaxID=3154508 RepID=UPI00342AE445
MKPGEVRQRWRRLLAASPHAPALPTALPTALPALLMSLVVALAVAESLAHAGDAPLTGHPVGVPALGLPPGEPRPAGQGPGGRPLAFVGHALLALATTLPAALLRARPLAAAALVTPATVVSLAAFQTLTIAGAAAQLVTAYRLGRAGPARDRPWAPLVLAGVPFPLLALAGHLGGGTGTYAGTLTIALAALVPATLAAGAVRHAARVTAAHEELAGTLLEHTARGERARIARELHDVVAHHISMVSVQAETARLTTPGLPAAGAERLTAIGDTARAALTEMRRLLGVLREDAGGEPGERRPQPGLRLGELNALVDEAREAAGSATRLILTGPPVPLDPGVELAAYRIVQEALTNARRHAPGAAVDVELHYGGGLLRVRVRDNGPGGPGGPGSPGGGHGLTGMRERAVAVGGELRAGPGPGGGFMVEATLPGAAA